MNKEKTVVVHTEHFDQNESNGNAATKYIVKFNNPVNCDWLRKVLDDALEAAQRDVIKNCSTCKNKSRSKTIPCYVYGKFGDAKCSSNGYKYWEKE